MTQFSQLSAYVKRGLKVERLIPDYVAETFIADPKTVKSSTRLVYSLRLLTRS